MRSSVLLVLANFIGCVELIIVTTTEKSVNVTVGKNVLLQCEFVTIPETKNLNIQWSFVSSSALKQVYYYQSGNFAISKAYEGRLQPPSSPATSRNASLVMKNMQPSDSGVYTCEVHNFPDINGTTQANIAVSVFARPSPPYCAVHGDVETGHLVTLSCFSEQGSPRPTYTWNKLYQAKTRMPVLGKTNQNGILKITNISQFQFGEYQCTASNLAGSSTCTIELAPDVGDGVIAGAVIGALLGCVLIVLVVWFITHTVKRHRYKAVKAPEATEMKRSSQQAQETTESVPMATNG